MRGRLVAKQSLIWIAPLTWMGLIFALSSRSQVLSLAQPLAARLIEIGGHMLAFGMLLPLLLYAMETTWPGRRMAGWALLFTLLYALADEYHQSFVPGRHATLVDVAADAAGMLLALGVIHAHRTRRGLQHR